MKDYKKIWNDLSTSFADAGHFVGYSDDEQDIRANGTLTANFLRDVLQIGPNDRVLEIGCGIARIGRELAPHCKEWHGTDISGNMISYAKERTKELPNVYLHELPEPDLGIINDGYFDCIYSTIVFMHLDKVEMFNYMCEAYRVLTPGGRAYFDTFNLLATDAWRQFQDVVRTYPAGRRPGHVSQFSTPQELQKYMEEANYEQIHIDAQNPQLVIALGRKPGATPSERSTPPLRTPPTAQKRDGESMAGSGVDESFREWRVLETNLRAKDAYIATLEETVASKNQHIKALENVIQKQQRSLSKLLVRIALRIAR